MLCGVVVVVGEPLAVVPAGAGLCGPARTTVTRTPRITTTMSMETIAMPCSAACGRGVFLLNSPPLELAQITFAHRKFVTIRSQYSKSGPSDAVNGNILANGRVPRRHSVAANWKSLARGLSLNVVGPKISVQLQVATKVLSSSKREFLRASRRGKGRPLRCPSWCHPRRRPRISRSNASAW